MESATIQQMNVAAYQIPTEQKESDGTLAWESTTLVVVHLQAGGKTGMGYTYSHSATAHLISEKLRDVVLRQDALAIGKIWHDLCRTTRNLGRPGVVASAIAAVDVALWDLKARLLEISLLDLLGPVRTEIPIYGSGGFTSYTKDQLSEQLGGWVEQGIPRVKMKVGRQPEEDPRRVKAARTAIGPQTELFVDANGAYSRKQALLQAERFAEFDVAWFEEPVSSDDVAGLRLLRDRAPAGMEITSGEYGYRLLDFQRLLEAEAVDVLMADATRAGGITGFLGVGPLCQARSLPLSAHTAPNLHSHVACACLPVRHVEYFFDHARIEQMLFDGALNPTCGALKPDRNRPGLGLQLKHADAEKFLIWKNH